MIKNPSSHETRHISPQNRRKKPNFGTIIFCCIVKYYNALFSLHNFSVLIFSVVGFIWNKTNEKNNNNDEYNVSLKDLFPFLIMGWKWPRRGFDRFEVVLKSEIVCLDGFAHELVHFSVGQFEYSFSHCERSNEPKRDCEVSLIYSFYVEKLARTVHTNIQCI